MHAAHVACVPADLTLGLGDAKPTHWLETPSVKNNGGVTPLTKRTGPPVSPPEWSVLAVLDMHSSPISHRWAGGVPGFVVFVCSLVDIFQI